MSTKKRWSAEEWRFCQKCFSECETIDDAISRFQVYYPDRTEEAIQSKFNKSGASTSEAIQQGIKSKIRNEKITSAKLKLDIDGLRRELDLMKREVMTSGDIMDFLHGLKDGPCNTIPDWIARPEKKSITGMPVLFLSDIHFDEVVDPAQVEGVNEYNRDIATRRIKTTFQSAIDLCLNYLNKPTYEGAVCALGGDILSGIIHEELAETNQFSILESAVFITELLSQGITALADAFGKVFVPCVVGNHGRLHRKPRAKNRVKDNYEWLIYHNIARNLKDDDRITVCIPESADLTFSIYNKTFLLTHGDQFRGGSGISGIFSPLFIGHARKQKRQQAVKKPFDIMMIGHWHQYIHTESLIVNGSIKGMDEYAYISNFGYERPQQALFIVHPSLGITYRMPVQCDPIEGEASKPLIVW